MRRGMPGEGDQACPGHGVTVDWRLHGQERYLTGARLRWRAYKAASATWDHDHCEFCTAEFAEVGANVLHEGWQSEDEYRWICKGCCEDFRGSLGFSLISEGSARRGVKLDGARLEDVRQAHRQVTVALDARVLDDAEGDSGPGGWQRVHVQLGDGSVETHRPGDGVVGEGRIVVGGERTENVVPLPFCRVGDVTLILDGVGLSLRVRARRVWFVLSGPPRDCEAPPVESRSLLDQFLTEECPPEVGELLRAALEAAAAGTGPRRKLFEFNRFDVALDFEQGLVVLQDDLDVSPSGTQRIPIQHFFEVLDGRRR